MARLFSLLLPLLVVVLGACGKEIGDSCQFATDCDANGQRLCVDPTAGFGGYCTIGGCDYSTCPDEAACIRFFTGGFTNKPCDPTADPTADPPPVGATCTEDELCSIEGHCVPRSSEVRFCMKTCGDKGDCRDGYECRDYNLAKMHGGEPVLAPGTPITEQSSPKFCAVAPST